MNESTLPPMPSYNPNIPVVTSSGGSSAAYRDKNSPESIMRDLHTLHVQSIVDQKFDVAESPYKDSKKNKGEGFQNPSSDIVAKIIAIFVLLCWTFLFRYHNILVVKKGKEYLITIFLGLLWTVSLLLFIRYRYGF
jgi:cation transport regulator ChaB